MKPRLAWALIGTTIGFLFGYAASARAAEDVLRPPVAKVLPAGKPVTYTGVVPARTLERDVFVTHRGQLEEVELPWGRPCRWRGVIPSYGGRNFIIVWHDTCRPQPRIELLSTSATVRVSLHVWYKPRPVFGRPGFDTPPEGDGGADLICEIVPTARAMARLRPPAPTPHEAVTP